MEAKKNSLPTNVDWFLVNIIYEKSGLKNGEVSLVKAQKSWCVAKPTTSETDLQNNLDYACSHADCHSLQKGNVCYCPNNRLHQASYAMNQYYQSQGRTSTNCNFSNSGLIAVTDPSYGNCIFEYGGNEPLATQTDGWCVAKPMAPPELLLANINYICGEMDCNVIQPTGECYSPDNIISHASVAMNMYYVLHNKSNLSCNFNNTGMVVKNDPSYGTCEYY
ncbi:glucan endo-1,3-beta-glucosidase 7 [Ricinus communis]|uniref:glucan endo-1,3-beta-glucosidase 7 n=1 Tax=Ricinus communis TaxID=3988 RepID=UPI00201A7B4E|nr:glucan endo-1,3-beta-glucosidase 7 [Ricinus communis]